MHFRTGHECLLLGLWLLVGLALGLGLGVLPRSSTGGGTSRAMSALLVVRGRFLALLGITRLWDGRVRVDRGQLGSSDQKVLVRVCEEFRPVVERSEILFGQTAQIVSLVCLETTGDERARGVFTRPYYQWKLRRAAHIMLYAPPFPYILGLAVTSNT